jgi:hypothetical protein
LKTEIMRRERDGEMSCGYLLDIPPKYSIPSLYSLLAFLQLAFISRFSTNFACKILVLDPLPLTTKFPPPLDLHLPNDLRQTRPLAPLQTNRPQNIHLPPRTMAPRLPPSRPLHPLPKTAQSVLPPIRRPTSFLSVRGNENTPAERPAETCTLFVCGGV